MPSSTLSEAPEPELPPEEREDDFEARVLQKARTAISEEANRLVNLMIKAAPQCTQLLKLENDIDQPGMVRESVVNKMRELGYEVHPGDGRLGTFTLHLEVNVPPDLYPRVLWADIKKNSALTGAYKMEVDKVKNEWPVWKKITNPEISIFTASNGSWVIGSEDGDNCWAVSMSTHTINPFVKDTVKGWGMPHSVGHWQLFSDGSWITDATIKIISISPELWIESSNKNLRGLYQLSESDVPDPVWTYTKNSDISLFSIGRGKYGWMVGQTPSLTENIEENTPPVGWVASVMQDSLSMPDAHKDWFSFSDEKWERDVGIKISRQRFQGPTIMVFRLVQTRDQHVTTASEEVRQNIEERARALVQEITETINAGAEKGRTTYDDLVDIPEGDVYYNVHVLERAIVMLGELGLDDLEVEDYQNGAAVRFTYQLHVETWGDDPLVLVENIKAELNRTSPGSWLQLSYSIPIDVIAQHLQEAGMDDFYISREGLMARIRIRVPWDTRDLWDSSSEKLKLEAKRSLDSRATQEVGYENASRCISPPRRHQHQHQHQHQYQHQYQHQPQHQHQHQLQLQQASRNHSSNTPPVFGPPIDLQSRTFPYPPSPVDEVFHPSAVGILQK